MQPPKWIFFDLGSTVLEGTFDALQGNVAVLSRSRNPRGVTPEAMQDTADQLDATLRGLKDQCNLEVHIHAFQRVLYTIVQIEPAGTPEEIAACFWDAAIHWHPTEGLPTVLAELDGLGVRKGIISNLAFSGETISRELHRHGLLGYFAQVISSADYGFRKPSELLFEVALLRAHCSPEDAWYVGDSLEVDMVGAVGAGMGAVWYNPSRNAKPRDLSCVEIRSWTELPPLVRGKVP